MERWKQGNQFRICFHLVQFKLYFLIKMFRSKSKQSHRPYCLFYREGAVIFGIEVDNYITQWILMEMYFWNCAAISSYGIECSFEFDVWSIAFRMYVNMKLQCFFSSMLSVKPTYFYSIWILLFYCF